MWLIQSLRLTLASYWLIASTGMYNSIFICIPQSSVHVYTLYVCESVCLCAISSVCGHCLVGVLWHSQVETVSLALPPPPSPHLYTPFFSLAVHVQYGIVCVTSILCVYVCVCTAWIWRDLILISDLWQHASDEKYNFERLQKTTVLQHQRLLQ